MEGEKRYTASEIEAALVVERKRIEVLEADLERTSPFDDPALYSKTVRVLSHRMALVGIIEQLRVELAEYRVSSGAPDEAFAREHLNAVARLRGEKRSEFTSVRTERQKGG